MLSFMIGALTFGAGAVFGVWLLFWLSQMGKKKGISITNGHLPQG